MSEKWTKGPWHIGGHLGQHDEGGIVILDQAGSHVATTWGGLREASPAKEWSRYYSDGRLIAAAPEMAEALADIIPLCLTLAMYSDRGLSDGEYARVQQARAALAKARGES